VGDAAAGRVAIVTGASRGIGQAIARRLGAEGASVVVVARTLERGHGRYAGSLDETVEMIRAARGYAAPIAADLSDPGFDAAEIVEQARSWFGESPDILVNNAAVLPSEFGFAEMRRDEFQKAVDVNVWAPWALALAVLPGMRTKGAGWILNISSRSAGPRIGPPFPPQPVAGQALYGATKAMLDRLTTGAALDLYEDNVAVNALSPEVAVFTEHSSTVADLPDDALSPVETMAEAALALCTGDPRVLTGCVTHNLSLLAALDRPTLTLDGTSPLPGWQPEDIRRKQRFPSYLVGMSMSKIDMESED
jgi:NAD(P)-dependent dehydrogenase (short-subunit alcohol dehydrogenase family)